MSDVLQVPGGGKLSDEIAFRPLRLAVMTVSDTRDEESDTSGKLLADRVTRDGHVLAARTMVRDDVGQIQAQMRTWIGDPAIDVIISTGGTGLTGRVGGLDVAAQRGAGGAGVQARLRGHGRGDRRGGVERDRGERPMAFGH